MEVGHKLLIASFLVSFHFVNVHRRVHEYTGRRSDG